MHKKKPSQDHTALLDYSENDINERNHVRLARKWKNIASWRFTVAAGAAVATCVLITNLILLIWAKTSLDIDNGVATAFIGILTNTNLIVMKTDSNDRIMQASEEYSTLVPPRHKHPQYAVVGCEQ